MDNQTTMYIRPRPISHQLSRMLVQQQDAVKYLSQCLYSTTEISIHCLCDVYDIQPPLQAICLVLIIHIIFISDKECFALFSIRPNNKHRFGTALLIIRKSRNYYPSYVLALEISWVVQHSSIHHSHSGTLSLAILPWSNEYWRRYWLATAEFTLRST